MYILKEALRKTVYALYQSEAKKYVAQYVHGAKDSNSIFMRNLACMLLRYQTKFLSYVKLKMYNNAVKDLLGNEAVCDEESPNETLAPSYYAREKIAGAQSYPRITVVTPNFNQGRFLEGCIQSVLSQNYPNLEYIIIDGGSTDNGLDIVKKYGQEITYWVSERDNGQADAINKGLKYATGEIFNWLNSDDRLTPGALFRCADAYNENPFAAGWVGGCSRVREEGSIDEIIFPNGLDRENIGQNWNGKQFYQPSCFLSTKRVKEVGGVDPSLYISLDLDLWIRILGHGDFVAGKGIWSEAITHGEAKTQKSIGKMLQETMDLQRKYGFLRGAERRSKVADKKVFEYTISDSLLKRLAQTNAAPYKSTFHERRNICFIGDFSYTEDMDAVIHFLRDIFVFILKRHWVEFHIVGKNTERCSSIVSRIPNVKCINSVKNPEEILANYKLFVCPMTQRGGLKGKIGIAAAAGLPVVTTSIGAGEFPVRDGEECFIADSPFEFAEKCNQCLSDPIAWHNFSMKAKLMAAENSSPFVASRGTAALFSH